MFSDERGPTGVPVAHRLRHCAANFLVAGSNLDHACGWGMRLPKASPFDHMIQTETKQFNSAIERSG